MHARTTHTVAQHKRSVATIGQSGVCKAMADGNGFVSQRLPQIAAYGVFKLIDDTRKLEVR